MVNDYLPCNVQCTVGFVRVRRSLQDIVCGYVLFMFFVHMCFCVLASTFSWEEKSLQQVGTMVARSYLWFHRNSVTYLF